MLIYVRCFIAFGIIALLLGCKTTLPNAKPFVETAIELRNSNEAASQSVENTFTRITKNLDPKDTSLPIYDNNIKRLKAESDVRIAFFNEILNYAQALNKVINKAEEENKKIEDLSNKITGLLNEAEKKASIAGPYAPMVVGGAEVGKTVNDLIAKLRIQANSVKTSKKLNEALTAAGPLFSEIAETFRKDLFYLSKLIDLTPNTISSAIWISYQNDMEYRNDLLRSRDEIIKRMRRNYGVVGTCPDCSFSFDKATADGFWGGKHNYNVLESIDKQLSFSKEIFARYDKEITESLFNITLSKQLIAKTYETLDAFGKAHFDFAEAVEDGSSVDYTNLFEYVKQLIKLQEQLKAVVAQNY